MFLREPSHLLLLLLVVVVLFGAKRLPDSARSLGKSMRIFKSEMKEMKDESKDLDKGPDKGSDEK
ncbi:TatA Sec-independent protein secretion pathway components [Candidatus Nanopelagicaceae bacterium]